MLVSCILLPGYEAFDEGEQLGALAGVHMVQERRDSEVGRGELNCWRRGAGQRSSRGGDLVTETDLINYHESYAVNGKRLLLKTKKGKVVGFSP